MIVCQRQDEKRVATGWFRALEVSTLNEDRKKSDKYKISNLRAFMVKVDHAEAEPTRAAETASFMVV